MARGLTLSAGTGRVILVTMMRFTAALAFFLLAIPLAAFAATLSGVMIFSTDHFGNPSAWNAQGQDFAHGQLWRTRLGGDWYGLGLLSGLPPANSDAPVLNAPDFSVRIPLSQGENNFTLVGEPSTLTRQDDFSHFALNLYFDGILDHPGISVLFPRYASRRGSTPLTNSATVMYALSLAQVKTVGEMTYSDGVNTVSVIAVSFLPSEKFGADYDKVSAHAIMPSSVNPGANGPGADGLGGFDYAGVLKINVEGPSDAAAIWVPGVPAAAPAGGRVDIGSSLGGDNAGYGVPMRTEQLGAAGGDALESDQIGVYAAQQTRGADSTAAPDAETTPAVGQTPTPIETAAAAPATPTPRSTPQASGSPGVDRQLTPTPAATRGSPTPAPRASVPGVSPPGARAAERSDHTPAPGAASVR